MPWPPRSVQACPPSAGRLLNAGCDIAVAARRQEVHHPGGRGADRQGTLQAGPADGRPPTPTSARAPLGDAQTVPAPSRLGIRPHVPVAAHPEDLKQAGEVLPYHEAGVDWLAAMRTQPDHPTRGRSRCRRRGPPLADPEDAEAPVGVGRRHEMRQAGPAEVLPGPPHAIGRQLFAGVDGATAPGGEGLERVVRATETPPLGATPPGGAARPCQEVPPAAVPSFACLPGPGHRWPSPTPPACRAHRGSPHGHGSPFRRGCLRWPPGDRDPGSTGTKTRGRAARVPGRPPRAREGCGTR